MEGHDRSTKFIEVVRGYVKFPNRTLKILINYLLKNNERGSNPAERKPSLYYQPGGRYRYSRLPVYRLVYQHLEDVIDTSDYLYIG